jgi:predicted metal-dependent hydrolase
MDVDFNLEIKKTSRKKTISFIIKNDILQVITPQTFSDNEIELLIHKKSKWIKNKLNANKLKAKIVSKNFETDEKFLFLGKNYNLKFISHSKDLVKLQADEIHAFINTKKFSDLIYRKKIVQHWFKDKALLFLTDMTMEFAQEINLNPGLVKIRSYKNRWGSCNSKGVITYNWKLVMAPESIIKYVVVHELCHRKHFNHSNNFWNEVSKYIPDYKNKKEWLNQNTNVFEW